MDRIEKQQFIRHQAQVNQIDPEGARILWSRHAITEMVEDDLTRSEIELALGHCELIEDYPTSNRPLPDCLILTYLPDGRPLHAVIAVDEGNERLFMITVYLPTPERWQNDWKTRR